MVMMMGQAKLDLLIKFGLLNQAGDVYRSIGPVQLTQPRALALKMSIRTLFSWFNKVTQYDANCLK